jgi:phosphate transport system protein
MTEPRHFVEELKQLRLRVLTMAELAESRVNLAMAALVDSDAMAGRQVVNGDADINWLQLEIDDRCFKLLALQQPMASDLRTIVAAVKINADLERIGDLAVNIAEAAQRYNAHRPASLLVDLPRMAELAQRMLREAIEAFVALDASQAERVMGEDDALDDLKNRIFRLLLTQMLSNQRVVEPAIDLILVSRHLERIGDHATNIAEDVIFIVNAEDVRHHAAEHEQTDAGPQR